MLSLNLRSVKLKNWTRFLSVNQSLHERITVQAANINDVSDDYVTVPAGSNAGLKIKTSVNNRNPRNLEMLNLARRDTGWGAGPTYKKRLMNVTNRDKNDDHGIKNELRNLPHQHGYHSINIMSTHGDLVAQCIHYTGKIILESSTKEDGIASQISSKQDAVAHYAVGRSLGIKMQMAGITNCSFPYLPSLQAYSEEEASKHVNKLDFAIGVEDEGIHIEEDLDEDSIWHQVQFTERKNSNVQTFTRGLTPDQIRINRGSMPE